MTDKVQKIREEVERLKGWNNNVRNSTRHMTLQEEDFNRGKHSSYLEILNFIDSLQEEPVNEELEKAAIEAFKQIVDSDKNNFLEIFKAGVNWQKQKDNQNESDMAVIAHLDGVEKGKKIMREQMMRGALEGKMVVGDESQLVIPSLPIITRTLDNGDKVKVIIIKED